MRSAPSRELPPNLKATPLLHLLPSPPLQSAAPGCAAGRRSAASSGTFSWFMACAPGFHSRVRRLERLSRRAQKTKNPPPGLLPAVGWKLFSILLAVFPIAGSGNSLLHSRSRGSRLGRFGSNSLLGDGHHHKPEPTMPFSPRKGIFRRPLVLSAFTLCFALYRRILRSQRGGTRGVPVENYPTLEVPEPRVFLAETSWPMRENSSRRFPVRTAVVLLLFAVAGLSTV